MVKRPNAKTCKAGEGAGKAKTIGPKLQQFGGAQSHRAPAGSICSEAEWKQSTGLLDGLGWEDG